MPHREPTTYPLTPIDRLKHLTYIAGLVQFLDIYSETAFTHLLPFGAVVLTRKRMSDPVNGIRLEYPTDTAGLEVLASTMNESISIITGWISLMGKFLAYTRISEFEEYDLIQFGWLTAGLAELCAKLNYEVGEIQYALKQDREQ